MRRWVAIAIFALGCESIAGIEDRHFEPGITGSPECENYCNLAAACKGPLAAYPNRDLCILTCGALPSGEVQKDNSLECRTTQAEGAPSEPEFYCDGAGPFGADRCGSTCEAYCTLVSAFCPTTLKDIDCATACGAIRHDAIYDFAKLTSGDSVECRIAYAVRASLEPQKYCAGAGPKSVGCNDPAEGVPSCDDFCKLAMTTCTGVNTVYETNAQCLAVCALMPKGTNADTTPDSVGCRKYHTYNALSDPATHCPHVSPAGDGHCGFACPSYCSLLQQTCPAEFGTEFGEAATCLDQCAAIPGAIDETYFDQFPGKDTMRCRFTNVARAAEKGAELATACAAAIGGGECAP